MDWHIRPLSRESTVSSAPFEVGERIICFLFRNDAGELERADVKADEVATFLQPNSILGRWERVVKDSHDEEREARQQVLASSEELFLSLFQKDSSDPSDAEVESDPDVEALKQVLSLMLERKRILKPVGQLDAGYQLYRHPKSGMECRVSTADLAAEQLLRIQESLNTLVL